MAHIGQELGLQDVGGVGGVAGLLQLAHGALEVFLALVQLAQQVIEALGQAGEQIVGGVHRDRLEAPARGHLAHGARQALHRLDDAVGQAPRQEERDAHPAEQQHEAEGDELGQHRREFGLAHGDLQPAHGLARHDDGPFDDFEVVGAGGLTGPLVAADLAAGGVDHPRGDDGVAGAERLHALAQVDSLFRGRDRPGQLRGRFGQRFVEPVGLGAGHCPLLQRERQTGSDQHHDRRDQADRGHARMEVGGRRRRPFGGLIGGCGRRPHTCVIAPES